MKIKLKSIQYGKKEEKNIYMPQIMNLILIKKPCSNSLQNNRNNIFMKKIELKLENRSYEVIINSDIAFDISKELKKIKDIRNIVIITQQTIYNLYSKILKKVLHENGLEFHFIILDDSENAKSLTTFSKVINSLIEFNCNKSSIILHLGEA